MSMVCAKPHLHTTAQAFWSTAVNSDHPSIARVCLLMKTGRTESCISSLVTCSDTLAYPSLEGKLSCSSFADRSTGQPTRPILLSGNVRKFARSPTVHPIYLLSKKMAEIRRSCAQVHVDVYWCCMVNARSEAYPCRQQNPSRLSEPNQWPVAGKPIAQAVKASRKQRKLSGYHSNQLEWRRIFVRLH